MMGGSNIIQRGYGPRPSGGRAAGTRE
jgi:hypothetical protein